MHDTDTIDRAQAQANLAWDEAFGRFAEIDAAFDEAIERHTAADEAADVEVPREDRFFDEYNLGMGMSRERVLDALRSYGWRAGEAVDEPAILAEFEDYQARVRAANKRHRVEELDAKVDELREPWREAREALMAVPAPDQAALLVKLEVALISGCDDHADSALADARRLLARDS